MAENTNISEESVKNAIEELRPRLQMDGGDIAFLGMEGNKAKVQLQGACVGCAFSQVTLKNGVEAYLKEKVPGVEGVISA